MPKIDPYVCPRGHHAVEIWKTRFRCKSCRYHGIKSSWDKSELVDLRREDPPLDERKVSRHV